MACIDARRRRIATTLEKEKEAAFFSGVWPNGAETHPRMTEVTAYAPVAKREQARYYARVFSGIQEMINLIDGCAHTHSDIPGSFVEVDTRKAAIFLAAINSTFTCGMRLLRVSY
jgi:hypothetical protein